MKKFKKFLSPSHILAAISVAFLIWVFLSWVEVVTHNGPETTGYIYNSLNIFKIISGGM